MDKRLIAILLALMFVGLLALRQLGFLSPEERSITGLDTATSESTRATKIPLPISPGVDRLEPVFHEAPVGFPGQASVEGRITTPEGEAIEGAEVRLCERLSPEQEEGLFSLPSPRAGEALALAIASSSGEYRFSDVRAGVYVVTAIAPGYAQDGRETPRLEDNSRQTGIDLALFPSASIRGVVVDEVGVAVDRAEVSATRTGLSPLGSESRWTRFEPRLSDPQGRFALDHLLPGTYRIEVVAAGYAPSQKTGVATDGSELRLVLRRGLRLQGRVFDSEERAVAGAEVQVRWSDAESGWRAGEIQFLPSRPLIANRYGNFLLEGVPRASAGIAVEVHATARGYSSASWSLSPEWDEAHAQQEQIRLVLHPGAMLKGSVVDRFGAPVPGASIRVLRVVEPSGGVADSSLLPWREFSNTRRGGFELYGFPPGRVDLLIEAEGYTPQRVTGVPAPGPPLEIILDAAGAILGRVVRQDDPVSGIGGAYVSALRISNASPSSGFASPMVRTGPDGAFALENLGPGVYELRASTTAVPGPESVRVEAAPGEVVSGVEIPIAFRSGLRGRVLAAANREAVAGARVLVQSAKGRREGTSGADGYFFFEGLPPGKWRVGAIAEGFVPLPPGSESSPEVDMESAGESDRVELLLERGGTIEGQAIDREGNPLPNIVVSTAAAEEKDDTIPDARRFPGVSAITAPSGVFSLLHVAPGQEFVIVARGRSFLSYRGEPMTLGEGETLRLDPIVLERSGRLRGKLLNKNGEGVRGWVTLDESRVETRADGSFEIDGAAGVRTLNAEGEGYQPKSLAVRIDPGGGNPPVEVVLDSLASD